jgi:hypothetical protein
MAHSVSSSFTVQVPLHFVQEYLMDITNWPAVMKIPMIQVPEIGWEGRPWEPGSVIRIRAKAAGIPFRTSLTVVPGEPGELFRYTQKPGPFQPVYTYAYAARAVGDSSTELTYTFYVSGWQSGLAKMTPSFITKQAQTFGWNQWKAAIESAWATKQSHP